MLNLFRGISLLSVFSKLNMACFMIIYEEGKRPVEYNDVATLGFRPGHSCGEIVGAVTLVHRAAWEWRGKLQVWTFSGDIQAAFDEMSFQITTWHGASRSSPSLIAAVLEESRKMKLAVDFQGCTTEVPFNKCLKQGGQESPPVFRDGLISVFLPVLREWTRQRIGVVVEGRLLNHLIWADNILIFAESQMQLRKMVVDICDAIAMAGMQWKKKFPDNPDNKQRAGLLPRPYKAWQIQLQN